MHARLDGLNKVSVSANGQHAAVVGDLGMKGIKMIFRVGSEQRAAAARSNCRLCDAVTCRPDRGSRVACTNQIATRQCLLLDCCMLYVPSFDPSKSDDAISLHLLCRLSRLDHHYVHRRAAQVKLIETTWGTLTASSTHQRHYFPTNTLTTAILTSDKGWLPSMTLYC